MGSRTKSELSCMFVAGSGDGERGRRSDWVSYAKVNPFLYGVDLTNLYIYESNP